MSTLFLTNPLSGRKKKAIGIRERVEEIYAQRKIEVRVEEIDFDRLDEISTNAKRRGIKNIYAVGGDGTVNAVGTKLIKQPLNFGVIPTGSGNGFARNIGFSINLDLAIKQTLNAKLIQIDTATFNKIPFLNICGIGLGATVAKEFSSMGKRGLKPYIQSTASGIRQSEGKSYRLTVDGKTWDLENILSIEIANGTQWGYEAKAAPFASLRDGDLDIVVIQKFPKTNTLGIVRKIFLGRVEKSRFVDIVKGKHIRVESLEGGPAHVDGESLEIGKLIDVKIVPRSLRLLLPGTLTQDKLDSL